MFRSTNDLQGFTVTTSEGDIAGRVEQFYFDDEKWVVRYLVVETGGWMEKQHVLISPAAINDLNWMVRVVKLSLTREQIENSPDIEMDKPVSRQREAEITEYFQWPRYWGGPLLWGAAGYPAPYTISPPPADYQDRIGASETLLKAEQEGRAARKERGDPHLRCTNEVTGYYIEAADGSIGHVEDFIVEEGTWAIRYIVVDTVNWWPGKKVLVSSHWIEAVRWSHSQVYVGLTRAAIKSAPEFDAGLKLSREYEARLHKHYRRTPYWIKGKTNPRGKRSKAAPRVQAGGG